MRKLVIPMLIAVAVFLVSCNSQAVDDSTITAKVKSKLAADTDTSAIKISVETRDGVVSLTGTVPTDAEKTKAEQIARATDGVKRVSNDIKVDPNSRSATNLGEKSGEAVKGVGETLSDAAILATVKAKLVADGITGTDVDVTAGEVILKGQVENASEKTKAENIVKHTAGVKDVRNQLTIKKMKGA
jgi:hyperosmotically inducible protein